MALVGIVPVGSTMAGLVFKLFGLTLERPTSWTLDQMTPHLPSNPHSNLKDISKVRPASVPLEATPFITDKMTAPNFALSFLAAYRANHGFNFSRWSFLNFKNQELIAFLSCLHHHLSNCPLSQPRETIWNFAIETSPLPMVSK